VVSNEWRVIQSMHFLLNHGWNNHLKPFQIDFLYKEAKVLELKTV